MNQNNDRTSLYATVLFLVWPFLSFITALRNREKPWAKNVCWAFVAFFGFTFAIGAENQGADIMRYISGYQAMHDAQMSLTGIITYLVEEGEIDIARSVISIILSRFTDNQAALTLTYGIIFGYFFSRNLWYVLYRLEGELKPVTVLMITCFFLVVPIWDMNGFRMYTAAHMFLYGLFPYLCEGKKKGLLITALSILVHFSFIAPLLVLFTYIVFGNALTIYFIFFVVTIFFSEIDIEVFNRIIENYAPEILQEETAGYRGEAYVERHRRGVADENLNWYAVIYTKALNWSVMAYLILFFIKGRAYIREHQYLLNIYSFTLLFYGFANILSSLPSGSRFLSLANLCALLMIIFYLHFKSQDKVLKRFIWASSPALLLFIIVKIRIGLLSMSATAIFGNPVIALLISGEHLSLNDLMRMIL